MLRRPPATDLRPLGHAVRARRGRHRDEGHVAGEAEGDLAGARRRPARAHRAAAARGGPSGWQHVRHTNELAGPLEATAEQHRVRQRGEGPPLQLRGRRPGAGPPSRPALPRRSCSGRRGVAPPRPQRLSRGPRPAGARRGRRCEGHAPPAVVPAMERHVQATPGRARSGWQERRQRRLRGVDVGLPHMEGPDAGEAALPGRAVEGVAQGDGAEVRADRQRRGREDVVLGVAQIVARNQRLQRQAQRRCRMAQPGRDLVRGAAAAHGAGPRDAAGGDRGPGDRRAAAAGVFGSEDGRPGDRLRLASAAQEGLLYADVGPRT
mmetsp:Transcript_54691/g.151429  ORF Transcript_54691/g.151429 Transcript_54691/m.151429 type:complete len:321 (-) Transcript_54691:87-1049(-)